MPILVPTAKLAALIGQQTIESNAPTVGDLLEEIRHQISAADWERTSRVAILVNGRNMQMLQGRKTKLETNDQVWMIVPSGGG